MADIELVIKMPEEMWERVKDRYVPLGISKYLMNGIPLPKGHGDLIDRRDLKKEVYTTTEWNGDILRIIYEASVDNAKPIIEADKGE